MKTALRFALLTVAMLFALISLLIPLSASQISKNKMLLADMKDCVRAIKEFQKKNDRLPTNAKLSKIEDSLPKRYSLRYGFEFGTPLSQPGMTYPKPKADSKGWMISYWRGEWSEYYSSWDDHYSLDAQASWWGFCGPLLFAPLGSVVFFSLRSLKVLRKNVQPAATGNSRPAGQMTGL